MKFLLDALFIYILIYSIYFVYITLRSLKNKKFKILQKYSNAAKRKNLCLIVYTHNNEAKLRRLLDCIKEQHYPAENISIFVILDNCDDNSEKINFAKNVQKFIIKDQDRVGKKQAISILVEKIHEYSVIDAFVFLDINRYIEKDFLMSINASLEENDIVSGATILFGESLTLRQKIKSAYQKYKMNFLERARACANLYTIIDSGVCAIKREIVESIGLPDFESLENDMVYSLAAANEKFTFTFNPNVKTYCEVHDFRIRIPRMSKRFNLFMHNIANIFSNNIKFADFVLFLLYPNVVFTILTFAILTNISLTYCYFADFSTVIMTICALIISFGLSLLNSSMRAREVICLALYPIYSFFHFLKHFFLWRFIKRRVCGEIAQRQSEETFEVDVEVTDGRGSAPCKLIFINECGMAKIRFLFKNKKITTKSHLRTYDAIDELINKLSDYGFTIKICQACSNFTSNFDGSTNLIKGFCKRQFQVSQQGELPVVVWNTCRGFSPKVIVKNFRG
jgi:hypothetical protein